MPLHIASSTITWNQFERPRYGDMLDTIREVGYSHVVAPGARRRPSTSGDDVPSTPEEILKVLAEHGLKPAPGYYSGPAYHDPANVAANVVAPGARRRPSTSGDDVPSTPEEILKVLSEHGLKPAPGYYSGPAYHDPANVAANVEGVRAAARHTRALGLDALFAGPTSFTPQRRAAAGHYPQGNRPDSFSEEEWKHECETLNRMGEACRAEGVWLALHNHAGACWETEDEMDRLDAGTDPNLVAWGPDVGHMVWGGIEPLPWFQRHMQRVKSIHIKDMHASVLERGRREKLSYAQQSEAGVFAEIGEGCVDWPALFKLWKESGYDGTVVVEIDRTTKASAQESITASRRYLKEVVGA